MRDLDQVHCAVSVALGGGGETHRKNLHACDWLEVCKSPATKSDGVEP